MLYLEAPTLMLYLETPSISELMGRETNVIPRDSLYK